MSFISLTLVLEPVGALLTPRADLVALIKPQFEAPRGAAKKGIVRDPAAQAAACQQIKDRLAALGWRSGRLLPSPIRGGDGNQEFLLEAARG